MSIGPKPVWDSTGAQAQKMGIGAGSRRVKAGSRCGSEVAQQSMV